MCGGHVGDKPTIGGCGFIVAGFVNARMKNMSLGVFDISQVAAQQLAMRPSEFHYANMSEFPH